MTQLHPSRGRADVGAARGAPGQPDDCSDQPDQQPATGSAPPRDYGHGSGDRNTGSDEGHWWRAFAGGARRDAALDSHAADPVPAPRR